MGNHVNLGSRRRAGFEDLLLAGLGILTGPLLWWMGQTWQQHPAASSIQSLEHWIALLCGFFGVGLSALWLVFIIAGLGFAIALKTKNSLVARWAKLFTPKFLQRIIISALGFQLAMGSQAFAAEVPDTETTPVASPLPDNAFMPQVLEQPTPANEQEAEAFNAPTAEGPELDAPDPTPEPASPSAPDTSHRSSPTGSAHVDKHPTSAATAVEPMPRQITTIPVPHSGPDAVDNYTTSKPDSPEPFVPEKPGPTPYITPPNPDRSAEDPTVVVVRGDSLWDLAHLELGADATIIQIDRRWRQWWYHNQDIIGNDPHTLVPGTVLNAPPFTE
ncbi:MAG TPA: hypothetical protein H9884_11645 [Candidatus Yaniella excrementigallinarum]|nr:hypothetical protein [Candidatus Yaniella excrementigallinarum]